ncbi:MAG: hypothetical protein JWM02_3666 [Frankiales bacterium]|nr:hypothetical protein [Frankiales bacterium]
MSWVRYDDRFHDHDKVAQLRASHRDVAALALHVLANTWCSCTDRPGFVPTPVPAMLVGEENALSWVAALVKAKLWKKARGGWEFANHEQYRAPANRQTPGTPESLSRTRSEAGRRGGLSTAAKKAANERAEAQANGAANAVSSQASVKQVSSNPCSPVVASNEATPEPEPGSAAAAPPRPESEGQRINRLAKAYTDRVPMSNFPAIAGVVRKAVRASHGDEPILAALSRLAGDGRSVTTETLRIELEGKARSGRPAITTFTDDDYASGFNERSA